MLEGFECRACEHLCSSAISMTEHCRKQHKKGKADSGRWGECPIQTFHPKNQGGYFIVARPQDEGTQGTNVSLIDDCITAMLEDAKRMDAEENEQVAIVDENQYTVDKSSWMRRTDWLREFAGK